MSDTAAQPWWADVQHLRPREDGGTRERRETMLGGASTPSRPTARFNRDSALASPLETAVAVAITDELPRLDDIDWHEFVDAHDDVDVVDMAGDLAGGEPAASVSTDPLAALDWEISTARDRDPRSGRRTVEIRGQVGMAATAPVDSSVSIAARGGTRQRPVRTAGERFHARPDRVALWAFLLGVVLMLVAALSAPEADAAMRLLGT